MRLHSQEPKVGPGHAPLLQMAYGALTSQILFVGAQVGLAERLAQTAPATANDLAPVCVRRSRRKRLLTR